DERMAVQARTFTRWINLVLQRSDPPAAVHDLFKDIQDGRILMALLEQLSGSKLLYRFRSPPQRIFRLKNISEVLTFLADKQVQLPHMHASAVVDGDPSVVLRLVWSVILHFQAGLSGRSASARLRPGLSAPVKQVVGGLPGHDGGTVRALLQRVQRCTSRFGVEVHDFGRSWRSGLAFLALVKSVNPALVDLSASWSREPGENLQQAFAIARSSLDVAPLLEPDDLLGRVTDEPSIITYVSMFFQ
uniref:Calponin-homology (CH) domain-containing protein n=1 Tax=Tetraodon nigroviridis TaxID=99883 RepID=H3CWG1_TETNG